MRLVLGGTGLEAQKVAQGEAAHAQGAYAEEFPAGPTFTGCGEFVGTYGKHGTVNFGSTLRELRSMARIQRTYSATRPLPNSLENQSLYSKYTSIQCVMAKVEFPLS